MNSLDIAGTNIQYLDTGSNKAPVIFLHGFPMSHEVWNAQVASLQSDYRCIVPDLRGFGRSGNNEGSLSFDLLASDIAALIAGLNLPSAHIVGSSLGAMIAMTFAATYPDLTRSVAIMHSEALPDDDEAKASRDVRIRAVEEGGLEEFITAFSSGVFPPGTDPEIIERMRKIMAPSSKEVVIAGLKLLRDREDMTPLLAKIEAPALVVAGELDKSSPAPWLEEMSKEIPSARFLMLKGVGHLSIMEQPETVSSLIREWLAEREV